jgi:hypothetical protein
MYVSTAGLAKLTDRSHSPCRKREVSIFGPLAKRNNIRHDDVRHGLYASCADALAGAAGKQLADIFRGATYNCAYCGHEQ